MDHVPSTSGGLIFSKFNLKTKFVEEEEKVKQLIKGTKKKQTLKKALVLAEKKEEKIKQLKQQGRVQVAQELSKKSNWSIALKRAEGVKVKDDLKLIKKTIKRVHKRKEKSAKLWQERKEAVERRQQARQNRRKRNLKFRTQEKIQRKIKGTRKRKGRA